MHTFFDFAFPQLTEFSNFYLIFGHFLLNFQFFILHQSISLTHYKMWKDNFFKKCLDMLCSMAGARWLDVGRCGGPKVCLWRRRLWRWYRVGWGLLCLHCCSQHGASRHRAAKPSLFRGLSALLGSRDTSLLALPASRFAPRLLGLAASAS